jgi:hypothetical protein
LATLPTGYSQSLISKGTIFIYPLFVCNNTNNNLYNTY